MTTSLIKCVQYAIRIMTWKKCHHSIFKHCQRCLRISLPLNCNSDGLQENTIAVAAATVKIPQLLDPGSCFSIGASDNDVLSS